MQYGALHHRTWITPTVQKPCKNSALTLGQIKNDDFNHRLDGDLSDHKGKFDTQKEECPLV